MNNSKVVLIINLTDMTWKKVEKAAFFYWQHIHRFVSLTVNLGKIGFAVEVLDNLKRKILEVAVMLSQQQ